MIDPSTLNWRKGGGLVPAVIQDDRTGRVLMLGYMDEAALRRTLATRRVTFYSRSKRRLWEKGETSGNTLSLVSVFPDCDGDVLLIRTVPTGPTCHTGQMSCFGEDGESALETVGLLIATIRDRFVSGSPESYTKHLLDSGVEAYGEKVLEEAAELVRAAKGEGRGRTLEEATDLLYHFLVLLRGQGVELQEISEELRKRRR